MKLRVVQQSPAEVSAEALVIAVFEGEKPDDGMLAELGPALGGALSRAIELGEVKGKLHEVTFIALPAEQPAPRLLIVGAGPIGELTTDRARTIAGTAVRALLKRKLKRAALWPRGTLEPAAQAQAIAEGAMLATFDAGVFKTGKNADRAKDVDELVVIELAADRVAAAEAGLQRGAIIGESQNYARTLANLPGSHFHPADLAAEARKLAGLGLEVETLDRDQLVALGMGGILAVGGGSVYPPTLSVLRYRGAGDAPFLGLVGKGVTFDSGGISIKPAQDMHLMKMDMSGAAAVLGAMRAIALLKPNANVLGVAAAVENMPSGSAYRPGDVITALNGKTIEVLNTDAEGRVILADAVAYAQRLGAKKLVDAATLTGACVVALGTVASGVMGTPQEWVDEVLGAARAAGEKMWQLPLFDEYKDQIKSDIADVANTGGRAGGAITAAFFIKEFVEDGVPWVHLDIAGTDSTERELPYLAKGAAGPAVRTFIELAARQAK